MKVFIVILLMLSGIAQAKDKNIYEITEGRNKTALVCSNPLHIEYLKKLGCNKVLSAIQHDSGKIDLKLQQCEYSEALDEQISIQPSVGCMLVQR